MELGPPQKRSLLVNNPNVSLWATASSAPDAQLFIVLQESSSNCTHNCGGSWLKGPGSWCGLFSGSIICPRKILVWPSDPRASSYMIPPWLFVQQILLQYLQESSILKLIILSISLLMAIKAAVALVGYKTKENDDFLKNWMRMNIKCSSFKGRMEWGKGSCILEAI